MERRPLGETIREENVPIIPVEERLIPQGWTYDREKMVEDNIKGIDMLVDGHRFEGYPLEGLRMTEEEYDLAVEQNRLIDVLIGTPDQRPSWFVGNHPNRYVDGDTNGALKQHVEDVSNLTSSDTIPLHPFLREMVTQSRLGVVSGPGFFYHLGGGHREDGKHANETSTSVILRERNGRLQFLQIEGTDGRGWVLPGGYKDPKREGFSTSAVFATIDDRLQKGPAQEYEEGEVAAAREAFEETHIRGIEDIPHKTILRGIPVGEWRTTANAWNSDDVTYFLIKDSAAVQLDNLQAGDDAQSFNWADVTEEELQKMSFAHPNYVRAAIAALEEDEGIVVGRDGSIGKAA